MKANLEKLELMPMPETSLMYVNLETGGYGVCLKFDEVGLAMEWDGKIISFYIPAVSQRHLESLIRDAATKTLIQTILDGEKAAIEILQGKIRDLPTMDDELISKWFIDVSNDAEVWFYLCRPEELGITADATDAQLADIADKHIKDALSKGVELTNTREYFVHIRKQLRGGYLDPITTAASTLGSITSPRKSATSRENGKKGGRPRK